MKKENSETFDVSVDDIEYVESVVGMGAGAWDMVNPKEIIAASWKRLRAKQQSNVPTTVSEQR